MGSALPVQEPSMDEILASIRRIIEGNDAPVHPASLPSKPGLRTVESAVEAPVMQPETMAPPEEAADVVDERQEQIASRETTESERVETRAHYGDDQSGHGPVSLKAVNDEGRTPFAGSKSSPVEREVFSQMEELATLSVARMRAASLEDAVRESRQKNVAAADADLQAGQTPDADNTQAFMDEFDEAAFANELLINVGLMSPPLDQPASVAPAEAVKLRLAYPERPAQLAEPDDDLSLAIDAATTDAEPEPAAEPISQAGAVPSFAIEDEAGRSLLSQADGDLGKVDVAARGALVSMISGDAQTKISASFSELAEVLRDEQVQRMDTTVREMLRPMLSDWLEDNLPVIVERLVREEIERVARGPKRA